MDEYVDAIISEHLEERRFFLWITKGKLEIDFSLGETTRRDGIGDTFCKTAWLEDLLWDLEANEFDETEDAEAAARMFETAAAECRARAQEIRTEREAT